MKKVKLLIPLFLAIGAILFLFHKPFDLLHEIGKLRRDLELDDSNLRYYLFYEFEDKVDSLIFVGDYSRASLILDSLLTIDDEFKYAWYFRIGKISYLKSEFELAELNFTNAINSTERNILSSYFWRSFALAKSGKCKEAIKDFAYVSSYSSKYQKFEKDLYSMCDSLTLSK